MHELNESTYVQAFNFRNPEIQLKRFAENFEYIPRISSVINIDID